MEYRVSKWRTLPETKKQYRLWQRRNEAGEMAERREWREEGVSPYMEKWISSGKDWIRGLTVVLMENERDTAVKCMVEVIGDFIHYVKFLDEIPLELKRIVDKAQKSLQMFEDSK